MESLAALVRRLRTSAQLTQEELAEAAGISARSVSDIERGVRSRLYGDTARRLADALGLDPEQGRAFLEQTRRPVGSVPATHRPPAPLGPLIGREHELAVLLAAVRDRRLVVVTGIGGIGKTRLGLAVCEHLAPELDGRIRFVAFTAGDPPERLLAEVSLAVGALAGGGLEAIRAAVGPRPLLVVLDAFEHLGESAAQQLEALLTACEQLRVLVTSRIRPAIPGEVEIALASLAGPAAAELFCDRAPRCREEDPRALAEVCERVDGHPLALELTAARARQLSLAAVRAELAGGTGGIGARLEDAVRGSIGAVGATARDVLRAAAMFPAGWELGGVDAVLPGSARTGLAELSDRGLVYRSPGEERRWRMYDLVRERVIAESPGTPVRWRRAYVAYYSALLTRLAANLGSEAAWHAELRAEGANVDTALSLAVELADADAVLGMTAQVWQFWQANGSFEHARRWITAGLALEPPASTELQALARWALAWLAVHQGDDEGLAQEAALLADLADQTPALAVQRNAQTVLGILANREGRPADSVVHLDAALAAARQAGRPWIVAVSLLNAGCAAHAVGDLGRAADLLVEGMQLFDALGDRRFHARCVVNLGLAVLDQGEGARADGLFRSALSTLAELQEPMGTSEALDALAAAAAEEGEVRRAATLAAASERLRTMYDARPLRFEGPVVADRLERARRAVDPEVWAAAWSAGLGLDPTEAISLALGPTPIP